MIWHPDCALTLPVDGGGGPANGPGGTLAKGVRWDLTDIYASPEDSQLAEDMHAVREAAQTFERQYRGKIASLSAVGLARALTELEVVLSRLHRPLIYASLCFAADTATPMTGALLQNTRQWNSQVTESLLFFQLEWLALADEQVARLLESPTLDFFRHHLRRSRAKTPYTLSEQEERILAVKANTGSGALQRLFDEVTGSMLCTLPSESVPIDNVPLEKGPGRPGTDRKVTLQEALACLYQPRREVRRTTADAISNSLESRGRLLGFLLNTLVQDHADEDRLRNRPHAMLSRNLDNEIGQDSVDALLEACDGGMPLVARYYDLKRRLLGYETLYDYDRYSPLPGSLPACTYGEARELVLEAYGDFSSSMRDIATGFFENGWIDAEPRVGKQGGAFSAATLPELHPYILLNYQGSLRDVMVLAHELGHGIHQSLSASKGLLQFQTPLTTAETASVFGEMLAFRLLMRKNADPAVRLGLLCGKLEDIFATVFRQSAMTRFEQSLHTARRAQGELSTAAIGELWMKANQAMFGASVTLSPGYCWWWAYIPHFIHTPFYCYAYSFGELLVLTLYRRFEEEGSPFIHKYEEVLRAGGSAAPGNLMATLGVDITDPGFWSQGVALLGEMLGQAEELAAQIEG